MYRRPKFLEVLIEIRQEMARQADYDVDLFAEMVRSGSFSSGGSRFELEDARIPAKVKPQKRKTASENGKRD